MTIYLTKNATNNIYLSVGEHFKTKGEYEHLFLFFTHLVTQEEVAVKPYIFTINERYCHFVFVTTADDPENANMLIPQDGMYRYDVVANKNILYPDEIPYDEGTRVYLTQGLCIVNGEDVATFDNESYPNGIIFNS